MPHGRAYGVPPPSPHAPDVEPRRHAPPPVAPAAKWHNARLARGTAVRYTAAERMKWTSWASLAGLAAIIGVVVWSSLHVGRVRCEVRRAATTNACALVASGVTESMACERTPPTRAECRRAGQWKQPGA